MAWQGQFFSFSYKNKNQYMRFSESFFSLALLGSEIVAPSIRWWLLLPREIAPSIWVGIWCACDLEASLEVSFRLGFRILLHYSS